MKLYVTMTSPFARLARIVVVEKGLGDRVEIVVAKTRTPSSPYYQINPSGRVPYLVDDAGASMEDSQIICAYLDNLDGKPRFHPPSTESDWDYRRLEARVSDPHMQAAPRMAHLLVAVALDFARYRGLGDLTDGRPQLAACKRRISDLPSLRATALPQ
jgi:glutathione S-transferase